MNIRSFAYPTPRVRFNVLRLRLLHLLPATISVNNLYATKYLQGNLARCPPPILMKLKYVQED